MQNTIILSQHISLPGTHNVLVVGGSASGKTHNYVLPNLMQRDGSYVVTDATGEMQRKTRKMFEKDGYQVKIISLQKSGIESIDLDDVAEIGHQKTVVYVIPSWDNATNEAVFPILISRIYEDVVPDAEFPIRLFLDEFANLGYIPKIGQYMGDNRNNGKVSCSIIVQSKDQLKTMYGEYWMPIIQSCRAILYFGSSDLSTVEFFFQLVGTEIFMGEHECLVIISGERAMVNSKYGPKMHPNYREIEK